MKAAIAVMLALMAQAGLAGTTYTWTGADDQSAWANPGNWMPATGYPFVADDEAVFTNSATVSLSAAVTNGFLKVTGSSAVKLLGEPIVVDRLQVNRNASLSVLGGSAASGVVYDVSAGGGKVAGFSFPFQNRLFLLNGSFAEVSLPMTFIDCVFPAGSEASVTVDGVHNSRYSARFNATSIILKLGGGVVHIR